MSYLHCPACSRAYNIAAQASCPYCPVQATPVDPTEDIVVAAESLARAMARASAAERDEAAARMERLALPAPNAEPKHASHGAMLRTIRNVLVPPPPAAERPTLFTRARSLIARFAPPQAQRLLDS